MLKKKMYFRNDILFPVLKGTCIYMSFILLRILCVVCQMSTIHPLFVCILRHI
uniref:Uncharacterized protein n=1 Tax=Anguilla anguilla TaxID=7936 RepID=A0A0E9T2L7_ANGAN